MVRFIPIEKDDITADPQNAGRLIAHALQRNIPMRFAGLCDVDDHSILIVLEEDPDAEEMQFVFSPFKSSVTEQVSAVIRQRYDAGFTTLAAFSIGNTLWGLFCRKADE